MAQSGLVTEDSENGLADVKLAGNFLAWSSIRGGLVKTVVVLHRRSRRVVTRVRAPARGLEDILEWSDLRDDGALLISTGADHQVLFVAPGATARRLPLFHPGSGDFNDRVRLVGERVALLSDAAGPLELKVGDFAGKSVRVDRFGRGHRVAAEFDFDGRRVTWAVRPGRGPGASIFCARLDVASAPSRACR